MQSVSTFFKEENDYLYKRGAEKYIRTVVENLLRGLDWSAEKIASVVKRPIEYVALVRAEMQKK